MQLEQQGHKDARAGSSAKQVELWCCKMRGLLLKRSEVWLSRAAITNPSSNRLRPLLINEVILRPIIIALCWGGEVQTLHIVGKTTIMSRRSRMSLYSVIMIQVFVRSADSRDVWASMSR